MLRRDRVRDEYSSLEKRVAHLLKEHAALQEELSLSKLDPAAAREKLLAKVKTDNARMQMLDREIKTAEDSLAAKRTTIATLEKEAEDRRGEAGDAAKYEALFKKDAEMTEFIDSFPDAAAKEAAEARRLGDSIVALLERVSEGILRSTALPSRAAAAEMKEDLDDKRRELKASEMTAERLNEELVLRQTELDKIQSLDGKLAAELSAIDARAKDMEAERPKFADLAGLRSSAEAACDELRSRLEGYSRRREAARPAGLVAEKELAAKRAALAAEPQAAALEAAEAPLKASEATAHSLRDYISSAGRDADYEQAQEDARGLLTELNVVLIKAAADIAAGIGGAGIFN
jgi:intraflagellar transport protein 74